MTLLLPTGNQKAVAAAVVIPTLIGMMDTAVVAAPRYIANDLSASVSDSEWVITSNLAAYAFILPISGWLTGRFGRRNFLLGSITVFTIASWLCGMATSVPKLILFRVIQGLGAGGLVPSTQTILMDSFPLEKQGAAQTLFSFVVLTGPILSPTLGGWLIDNFSWRCIFLIQVPAGLVAFLLCYALLDDPDYLRQERAELRKCPFRLYGIGLGLLALVIASWEVMLSKGQDWDWLNDPLWRVQALLIVFVLALAGFIYRELTCASPVVNLRVLRERNFAVSCGITFGASIVVCASSLALPLLLFTLFGYDDNVAGSVLWPACVFAVLTLLAVGCLLGWGIDARWLIASGLILMAAGNCWMALMKLDSGPWLAIWPRVVTIIGLLLMFAPLNVAAFLYTPKHLRGAAVGLLALLRYAGGSFGVSMVETIHEWRTQFHTTRMGEFLDPLNPMLEQNRAFLEFSSDPAVSQHMAMQSLAEARHPQAAIFAYFDVFWVAAVASLALVFLVFLMKRSVTQKSLG